MASVLIAPAPSLTEARARLAEEWQETAPNTAEEITAFYRSAHGLKDDLNAWHATVERTQWENLIIKVATDIDARMVIDIGCGAGHDLRVLKQARPTAEYIGVELNDALREELVWTYDIPCVNRVEVAPIESADLLICVDVLEHVPDPTTFLGSIAERAKIGCHLFETTATFDLGTPLHLPANKGWHPGRVLEQYGWAPTQTLGRVRIWRRMALVGAQTQSILLCAYRAVTAQTMHSLLATCTDAGHGWRLRTKIGDALIARSRAVAVTRWFLETNDDVFLMVDDDLVFTKQDADRLVALCRDGYDIVCGGYSVHDGAHLACRGVVNEEQLVLGPGKPPIEIVYAATGFMAVRRNVIETLVAALPLCHAKEPWAFYPLFHAFVIENEGVGGYEYLSEDYAFSELARRAGFRVWLDAQTKLIHLGQAPISPTNMAAMHQAIAQV